MGHALMENRHGLAVDGMVTQASGTAEREAAEAMIAEKAGKRRITLGADKAYDAKDHVAALRAMDVTPHVAQNDAPTATGKKRKSAIDARTTRHVGYRISQVCRKASECIVGWGKQHGTLRKAKQRGEDKVEALFKLNLIGYNLIPLPKPIRRMSRTPSAVAKNCSAGGPPVRSHLNTHTKPANFSVFQLLMILMQATLG